MPGQHDHCSAELNALGRIGLVGFDQVVDRLGSDQVHLELILGLLVEAVGGLVKRLDRLVPIEQMQVTITRRIGWQVVSGALPGKAQNTPFDGRALEGRVLGTWKAGKRVFTRQG